MDPRRYCKHFLPLESNPEVFTDLAHRLGADPRLRFQDVWSFDEVYLPSDALALILLFPTSEQYEAEREAKDAAYDETRPHFEHGGINWFPQTINNACGLYAILHAISNGDARNKIVKHSILDNILTACLSKPPAEYARALEESEEVEDAYTAASVHAQSEPAESAEDEVDFHFVAFVGSPDEQAFELDGDRRSPVNRGVSATNMACPEVLDLVKEYINQGNGNDNFSLMALVYES